MNKQRKTQIVIIGSSNATQEEKDTAYQIGSIIANKNAVLVTGGRGGVMEAASKGASENNGEVVGIIPDNNFEAANKYCSIVIPSGIGFARNLTNVLSGDIVIVVGGSSGTLSEIAYAWQFNRTILACSWIKGYSQKYAGKQLDNRRQDVIISIKNIKELENELTRLLSN